MVASTASASDSASVCSVRTPMVASSRRIGHCAVCTTMLRVPMRTGDLTPELQGLLQKAIQQRYQLTPTYEVIDERGPEHERVFEVEARVGDKPLGRGKGLTKQIAQQAAAREALQFLESLSAEDEKKTIENQ